MITETWNKYERGKEFLESLGIISKTTQSYNFYEGRQWEGLQSGGEKMPILDVIKPIVDYKTAILTQNYLQANFSSQNYEANPMERAVYDKVCSMLNSYWLKTWESNNMDSYVTDVILNAEIAGDAYVYAYYEDTNKTVNGKRRSGRTLFEVVDNTRIMFANENEADIQKQDYILMTFRKSVEQVKAEAKANGIPKKEIDQIQNDNNKDVQTGSKKEVQNHSKCLCILEMWKENGTVHIRKATRNVEYQHDTDLKLTKYPVARYLWEPMHGLCRGVSEVYKLIPNQIWINRLEAYRLISTKLFAFPKLVYSSNLVNKEDVSLPAVALEVDENDLNKAIDSITYINPAPMSQDAMNVQSEMINYTKDSAGASDIATGREKLDNASALLAIQESSQTQLAAQKSRFKRFIEDLSRIMYDFWCTYYVNGIQFIEIDEMGNSYAQHITTEQLKDLEPEIRVDVTPTSPFNKLNEMQKADNLIINGVISLEEYTAILPNEEPMKAKLETVLMKRQEQQMIMNQMQSQIDAQNQQIAEQSQMLDASANAYKNLQLSTQNKIDEAYLKGSIDTASAREEINGNLR